MLGPEVAPKITGMIIDLPPQDLNMSVLQYHSLQQKVRTALQLLVDSNTLQKPLVQKAQAFLLHASSTAVQMQLQMHAQGNVSATAPQQVMAVQEQSAIKDAAAGLAQ